MNIKSREYLVSYYDSDNNRRLRTSNILRYFAESSVRDTERGFKNLDKMDELGYGWMLAKWKVAIKKYPKTGDKISIETWVSNINKFYMNREYLIKDDKGKVMIKGSGLWIFIDTSKRKLIRITDEFFDRNYILEESNFEEYFNFEDRQSDLEISLRVRRSDIDSNQHVNNIKYLDWIIESVPDDIYLGYTIRQFEIQYKKEIRYPANVNIYSDYVNDMDFKSSIHNIVEESSDKTNCFVKIKWESIENK